MPSPIRPACLSGRTATTLFIVLLLSMMVLAFDFHLALLDRVGVPLSDGWPVLHRIMLFENGEMSWRRYLLSPHGAHLHAIIYFIALLDFYWLGGQQELQTAASLLATATYILFLIWLMAREGLRQGRHPAEIALVALAAAALLSGLSDLESMLVPFQAVLTVSRLAYIGLFWALCVSIVQKRPVLYALVIAAALPAVTFHGAGQLFAFCIILIHLLLRQRLWRVAVGCLPMLCALAVQSYYSVGGGELASLGMVLTPRALIEVPLALAAYFASPFVAFLHIVDSRLMLIPGAILACSTILLTLLGLRETLGLRSWSPAAWWRQYRFPAPDHQPVRPEIVLFTILGLLLLMSGAAAALFWFIRVPPGLSPWRPVLDSTRYGAYSTLAYLLPLAAWMHTARRREPYAAARILPALMAVAVFVLGIGGTWRMSSISFLDDRLNIALAAISAGLPPTLPQTEAVWPQANTDWYWKNELPRTVEWLRRIQAGPWRDLPAMQTRGGASFAAFPLNNVQREPMPADTAAGWCRIVATVPTWGRSMPPQSKVVPVASADGTVIGFAALTRASANRANRTLSGVVTCVPDDASPLFTSRNDAG